MSEQPRPGDRKPQKGDRVRATLVVEGVLTGDYPRDVNVQCDDGSVMFMSSEATVEVVEPADDPSQSPIGEVRESLEAKPIAKLADNLWWMYGLPPEANARLFDVDVRDSKVVGAVPGTPAAEAQRHDMGYCGTCKVVHDEREPAVQLSPHGWEPRVFQSDGPEPPEDVKALRWLDRSPGARWVYLIHTRSGWVWAPSPTTRPLLGPGAHWDTATRACPGRYEEVQP